MNNVVEEGVPARPAESTETCGEKMKRWCNDYGFPNCKILCYMVDMAAVAFLYIMLKDSINLLWKEFPQAFVVTLFWAMLQWYKDIIRLWIVFNPEEEGGDQHWNCIIAAILGDIIFLIWRAPLFFSNKMEGLVA